MNEPPSHVDAIIREAANAMIEPAIADRQRLGLPRPGAAELKHFGRTLIGCATTAVAATLLRVVDWSPEQVDEAFAWLKTSADKTKVFGNS